jgi:hypothetical protein
MRRQATATTAAVAPAAERVRARPLRRTKETSVVRERTLVALQDFFAEEEEEEAHSQ